MARKTKKQFNEEIIDRPLNLIGEYERNSTPSRFLCDKCQHEWMARPANVKNGTGCPDCAKKSRKKKSNNYIISVDEVVLVDVSTDKFPETFMKTDVDTWGRYQSSDNGRVLAFDRCKNDKVYAAFRSSCGRVVKFHRFAMDANDVIDHINGNGLDNRRSNLRECTQRQNSMNCAISKNNNSGVAGVSLVKSSGTWRARIMVDRKEISLGRYLDFKDAVKARRSAEEKYFGEFAFVGES